MIYSIYILTFQISYFQMIYYNNFINLADGQIMFVTEMLNLFNTKNIILHVYVFTNSKSCKLKPIWHIIDTVYYRLRTTVTYSNNSHNFNVFHHIMYNMYNMYSTIYIFLYYSRIFI